MISAEPAEHIHIPGTKHPEPKQLYASLQSEDYTLHTVGSGSQPVVLLGNILLAEKTRSTPEDVEALLKKNLISGSPDLPSEAVSEHEPDYWIRKGEC